MIFLKSKIKSKKLNSSKKRALSATALSQVYIIPNILRIIACYVWIVDWREGKTKERKTL